VATREAAVTGIRSHSVSATEAEVSALQAEAWLAWLAAASVAVFLTSSPFYLATACLVALIVYEAMPGGRRRSAYGWIVKIGLFFALLSIPFNVLTGSSGSTALVELPRLSFPGWMGGVTLGGDVTAEALLFAGGKALRLVALLLFAAAFNVAVDHYRLLRMAPAALRQLGVVLTVAVLLLPQAFAQGRAVAEAQRLRGRRLRGVRNASAFVVPVLAGALERSIQRAESLDARGFGSQAPAASTSAWRNLPVLLAVALAAAGIYVYLRYPGRPLLALSTIAAAVVVVLLVTKARGRRLSATRYSRDPLTRSSSLVIVCSVLSLALLLGMRLLGLGAIAYYPYPAATMPDLHPLAVFAVLLLLVPALSTNRFQEARDD
jgi:energy-coupling factor transport system permease protein